MRKFLPILTLAFASLFIYSCDNNDDVVEVQAPEFELQMKDITGTFGTNNNFSLTQLLALAPTDGVLVYRNTNSNTTGSPVWQLIPKTYYLTDVNNLPTGRELDYNFDFTTADVVITTEANFNQSNQLTSSEVAQYLTNQTFRIILLPAKLSGKGAAPVDYNDYNAVIKYYNLNDSKVQNIKIN